MSKKIVLKWIFLFTLAIWLIISVFFYFQHRIQVDTYEVGKYIEFEDFSIFVKNIEKYNYENKSRDYPDILRSLDLPWKITETILKINYFYSQPYYIYNDSEKFNINCVIVFDQETTNYERVAKMITDKLDIVYNRPPVINGITSESETQHRSNTNSIHYRYTGECQDTDSMNIRIIYKESDEEYSISIDKPFLTNTYGYFNRKLDDTQQMASDTVKRFIWLYNLGEVEDSKLHINQEYIENFPWNILNQYKEFKGHYYEFKYLGKYMNDEGVFIMTIYDDVDNDFNNCLEFYMIYEDMRWQIIDVR